MCFFLGLLTKLYDCTVMKHINAGGNIDKMCIFFKNILGVKNGSTRHLLFKILNLVRLTLT